MEIERGNSGDSGPPGFETGSSVDNGKDKGKSIGGGKRECNREG